MIQLTPEELRKLQMIELEMLLEVDRICKKHGIHYNIIAGTMLGAVRHGGFIPWDDDVDVAMLRPEYDRFREICGKELDASRFYFQDHVITPGYRWGYGKLRRKDTLFLREHQEHMPYEQGVFIDVFPMDQVPDSRFGRTRVNLKCFLVRKLLWARVGKKAERSGAARFLFSLLDRIPEEKIKGMLDRLISESGKQAGEWVRILMFPTPNREYGYKKRWYAGEETVTFEGLSFPGTAFGDEYLSFKFGNYHELPPESQRKTHPVSALKLTEPRLPEGLKEKLP